MTAYRFIQEYGSFFGVRWLLKRLNIYPNAYYNFLKNRKADYYTQKQETLDMIEHPILDMEVVTSNPMLLLIENNFGIGFVPKKLASPLFGRKETCADTFSMKVPFFYFSKKTEFRYSNIHLITFIYGGALKMHGGFINF